VKSSLAATVLKRVVSGKGLLRAREIIVQANPDREPDSFRFDARY